jgi:hypothetical protein
MTRTLVKGLALDAVVWARPFREKTRNRSEIGQEGTRNADTHRMASILVVDDEAIVARLVRLALEGTANA